MVEDRTIASGQQSKGRGKKEKEQISHISNLIHAAESWRDSNYKDLWLDCYRRWRSRPKERRDGSNIFVPYSFMIQNVISSRCAESLFATRPAVSVLARNDDASDNAEKVQTLLDWVMAERMQLPRLFSEQIISSMCIYGTVVTHTAWKKEVKRVQSSYSYEQPVLDEFGMPAIDENTGAPIVERIRAVETTDKVVYDDPYTQFIDLLDFFVDPKASGLDDARYCGHKEYRTKAELERFKKDAGWKIDMKKLKSESSVDTGQQQRYQEHGNGDSDESHGGEEAGGLYKVYHFWEDNRHYVLVGDDQLAVSEDNPYYHGGLPYDMCRYLTLPQEFYGVGLMEMLAGLQDELNTFRNQRIDYNSMALRRMWKLRKGCGLTARDMVWRQNGVLQVENMDDVMEIPVQQLPASAFANEASIKQDMKDATGCHDILMGVANQDETATTTMTKDNNASIRFKEIVRALADDLVVPIAQKCVSLEQQFMTVEKSIRLGSDTDMGGVLVVVNPFETEGEYDLIYVGTAVDPMANKTQARQNLIQAIQIAQSIPAYQQSPDAVLEMMRKLLLACDFKDVDKMLPSLQPMIPPQMAHAPDSGMPPEGMM